MTAVKSNAERGSISKDDAEARTLAPDRKRSTAFSVPGAQRMAELRDRRRSGDESVRIRARAAFIQWMVDAKFLHPDFDDSPEHIAEAIERCHQFILESDDVTPWLGDKGYGVRR